MFPQRLKQLRKENKVTQKQLAGHFGYYHTAVVKWEKGSSEPSIETLIKIADFFDVTLDNLLGRVEPTPLTESQKKLVDKVQTLSEEQVSALLAIANQFK